MKLTYNKIKDKPEVLISLTTLRREEFEVLSEFFEQSWQEYYQDVILVKLQGMHFSN